MCSYLEIIDTKSILIKPSDHMLFNIKAWKIKAYEYSKILIVCQSNMGVLDTFQLLDSQSYSTLEVQTAFC
jgi:hypothetical protein